jgi:hypothetical protein
MVEQLLVLKQHIISLKTKQITESKQFIFLYKKMYSNLRGIYQSILTSNGWYLTFFQILLKQFVLSAPQHNQ